MLPDAIPEDILIPKEPMGMKELAGLYKKSITTLQRAFKKNNIYTIIGKRQGYDFTPKQLLVIFYLYMPPAKYYMGFTKLEVSGYIRELLKQYGIDPDKKD